MERIIGQVIKYDSPLSDKAKNIKFEDGILHEHNKQPYINIVETIEREGKACAIHATGTGKMYLALKWLNDNKNKAFVYIAPTNLILNKFVDIIINTYFPQHAKNLKLLSLDDEIDYIQRNLGVNLQLYTYAKINSMSDEEMQELNVDNIVLDEFHRCGADKWGKSVERFLNIHNKAQLLGLTATPIRPSDGKNMVEELFDGRIASEITLKDAFEQNILPLPKMINAIYSFENEINSLESRLLNKKFDPDKQNEIDKKLKDVKKLISQSGGIRDIFSTYLEEFKRDNGKLNVKFVVFCKDIADRDAKMEECKTWFDKHSKIKKYSVTSKEDKETSKDKKITQKIINAFEKDDSNAIKLLFVVDMLNEGVHIKDLDGVIMLRDTNSNIVFLQQLGRALASGSSKSHPPIIFDLVNNIEVLAEDIAEYKEVVKSLIKPSEINEREINDYNFKIQAEIINIIQYLKNALNNNLTFEERLEILTSYAKKYGTIADIKREDKYNYNGNLYSVGNWIAVFRQAGKGVGPYVKLTESQKRALEDIGMEWNIITPFETKIEVLTAYAKEYGTIANIKQDDKYTYKGKEYSIGDWIINFRIAYKGEGHYSITREQQQKLDKLGMTWEMQISFEQKLTILTAYAKEHGTIANIKQNEKYICDGKEYLVGRWIAGFRNAYKGVGSYTKLTVAQCQALEKLGMVWDIKIPFNTKLEVLTAYAKEYGSIANIKRSCKYIYKGEVWPLGMWIASFRNSYKGRQGYAKLTPAQQQALENLGILWTAKNQNDKTQTLIQESLNV